MPLRLISRPVRIFWAGFETDTHHLQHAGWELSADQDIAHRTMCIAGSHPQTGAKLLTEITRWDYEEAYYGRPVGTMNACVGGDIHIHDTGREFRNFEGGRPIRYAPIPRWRPFEPIDAIPQMIEVKTVAPEKLEDLVYFAPRIPQLIAPEAEVSDLLGRIQELQKDGRREYLKSTLKQTIGVV